LALRHRDAGVVGFDIAGPEAGFPPERHASAFATLRAARMPVTVHAGEADGLASIDGAIDVGALRLGHGVRITEDLTPDGEGRWALGRTATWVRDRGMALETSPSSNVQTAAVPSAAEHPAGLLAELGFAVTVNTDNRLMSGTTLSREFAWCAEHLGWGLDELYRATRTALGASFHPEPVRQRVLEDVVRPAWVAAGADVS
jgi:adenosine deaminase